MVGINTLLDIGRTGLFASQTSIETIGNNIANVNTPGYTRRTTVLDELPGINASAGQIGRGVDTVEVVRHFDRFIEASYLDKSSDANRWSALFQNMQAMESLYNEANGEGISATLAGFFAAWQDLSQRPDSYAAREALLMQSTNLQTMLHQADTSMTRLQEQVTDVVRSQVDEVNRISQEIAKLNQQITAAEVPGSNNPNELYDERDQMVRRLSELLDVKVIDNGAGDYTVMTESGHTLVDGVHTYHLAVEGAQVIRELSASSAYTGTVAFDGSDEYEYQIKVVQDGMISNASGPGTARFGVSFDGGKTWDMGPDGNGYYARPEDGKLRIRNLDLGFTVSADPAENVLSAGDTFTVVPKDGVYWYKNTAHKVNLTPMQSASGANDPERLTGGSITGSLNFRDGYVGRYRDKLDALSRSLIWEVNRLHSQGTGTTLHDEVLSDNRVNGSTIPLGSDTSGLVFASRMSAGNAMLYVYDEQTGELTSSASLDFSAAAGVQNFDPDTHSLQDVADAVNRSFTGSLTADIVNGQLRIQAADGKEFAFGSDTTGVWAALGVNSFFTGEDAGTLGLSEMVSSEPSLIATGHVNGAGEANAGDNSTAVAIANLETGTAQVTTLQEGTQTVNLLDFYNSLVTNVGADTANAEFNQAYEQALATDLDSRQKEVSGVNLDQEMAELIRFQHSYTAAAKLIQAADEMLQTLLSLKQ